MACAGCLCHVSPITSLPKTPPALRFATRAPALAGHFPYDNGSLAWIREQPPVKAYANVSEDHAVNGYELTEPAIHYQAIYIRLLAPFALPRT